MVQNLVALFATFILNLLYVDECFAKINYVSNIKGTILSECLSWKKNETIVLSNQSFSGINNHHRRSSIMVEYRFKEEYFKKFTVYQNKMLLEPSPRDIFLIEELNLENFKDTMDTLKQSVWWNVYGFYIVQKIYTSETCHEAYIYFEKIWKLNILNSIFMCLDSHLNIQILTFSPYSSKAPMPWIAVKTYIQENGHPFTLFQWSLNFEDSSSNCKNFNFDKTLDLSGYPINICVPKSRYCSKEISPYKICSPSQDFVKEIWPPLKPTAKVIAVPGIVKWDRGNESIPASLLKVLDGKCDMHGHLDYSKKLWRNELNTNYQSGICYVISEKHTTISILILHLLSNIEGNSTVFCICAIIITIFLALWFKQSFVELTIDILRAAVGVAMLRNPIKLLQRITFILIVIFFMTLNFYLQSRLRSLLVIKSREKIENQTDLLNLGYQIHTPPNYRSFFPNSVIYRKNETLNSCIQSLNSHSKISCAHDCLYIKLILGSITKEVDSFTDENLKTHFVFIFSNDHPLLPRVRSIYSRLHEDGLTTYIKDLYFSSFPKIDYNDSSSITFDDLKPVFILLSFGLTFAIFTFAIEACVHWINIKLKF